MYRCIHKYTIPQQRSQIIAKCRGKLPQRQVHGDKTVKRREEESVSLLLGYMCECVFGRFNTRQCDCVHLWQLAINTKRTDNAEFSPCVLLEDKALFCFSLLWVYSVLNCLSSGCVFKPIYSKTEERRNNNYKKKPKTIAANTLPVESRKIIWIEPRFRKNCLVTVHWESTVDKWGNAHLIRKCSDRAFACPVPQNFLT